MRLALSILLIVFVNGFVGRLKPLKFSEELPQAFSATQGIVGGTRDLLFVSFGLRPVAADFAMVDLLVYYGTHEEASEDWHHVSGRGIDTGMYLDILPLTKRVVGLDPFFRYAALYGAGALAFNEGRHQEAVSVLEEALRRDPHYWPYALNLSAIAYKKTLDFPGTLRFLEQIYPLAECPTMLKNILANIYLKTGQKEKAIRIFKWMALHAPESDYRDLAGKHLAALNPRHPS